MIYELTDPKAASPLFGRWEETLIWSCLQGVMGNIYADDPENPLSAAAVLGDFTFFAGEACRELAAFYPPCRKRDFMIAIPQNAGWERMLLLQYGSRAKVISRYATKKEPEIFSIQKLEAVLSSVPDPYKIRLIDEQLYEACRSQAWSFDLVSQFRDYDTYKKLGLGVVIQKNGRILSGASSYSRYQGGIEIEIDTRPDCRRQGLALRCGARLILECLHRHLYPSWDAHSRASLALAEKLGYRYSHTYTAIEISSPSLQEGGF